MSSEERVEFDNESGIVEAESVGNYYGSVAVIDRNGKFYMSVENWDGRHWTEISETLYDAFVAEFGNFKD